jgi:hypothetical protein
MSVGMMVPSAIGAFTSLSGALKTVASATKAWGLA